MEEEKASPTAVKRFLHVEPNLQLEPSSKSPAPPPIFRVEISTKGESELETPKSETGKLPEQRALRPRRAKMSSNKFTIQDEVYKVGDCAYVKKNDGNNAIARLEKMIWTEGLLPTLEVKW